MNIRRWICISLLSPVVMSGCSSAHSSESIQSKSIQEVTEDIQDTTLSIPDNTIGNLDQAIFIVVRPPSNAESETYVLMKAAIQKSLNDTSLVEIGDYGLRAKDLNGYVLFPISLGHNGSCLVSLEKGDSLLKNLEHLGVYDTNLIDSSRYIENDKGVLIYRDAAVPCALEIGYAPNTFFLENAEYGIFPREILTPVRENVALKHYAFYLGGSDEEHRSYVIDFNEYTALYDELADMYKSSQE